MLRIENLYVRKILKGVNLRANRGEFITIVGENGAGKSTLFSAISGITKPKSGKIYINEKDITTLDPREISTLVASVLQDPKSGTIGEMTIFENMKIAYLRGKKRSLKISKGLQALFQEKLTNLGMNLENRLEEYVKNLSGGERQALSLIMATLTDYEVLLLDEITAALSPSSSEMVMRTAVKIAKIDQKVCILITHDTKYIGSVGNKTYRLEEGVLRLLG